MPDPTRRRRRSAMLSTPSAATRLSSGADTVAKLPVIAGALAAAGLIFWGIRRASAATGDLPPEYNDCLNRCMRTKGWTVLDCDAICSEPERREEIRQQVQQRWCDEHPEEPSCADPAGLRQLPERIEPMTQEEYEAMMALQAQRAVEAQAAREQAAADNLGVSVEMVRLINRVRADGVDNMAQRRQRLVESGILRDRRNGLPDHVANGRQRWAGLNILQRVEAVKDWLSLRRAQQYDHYSWKANYDQQVACAQGNAFNEAQAAQCAAVAAEIAAAGLQYPKPLAFVAGWTMRPVELQLAPAVGELTFIP